MDKHTWAFAILLALLVALAGMNFYLLDKINTVKDAVRKMLLPGGLITECRDHARSVTEALLSVRKKQLDEQEFHIHEEVGNLNRVLFKATSQLKEFTNLAEYGHPYASPYIGMEDSYDNPAGAGRYSPGGGGASGGAPYQADLPDAPGKIGGAG